MASDGTTVLTNDQNSRTQQVTASSGYYYDDFTLPLSSNAYYNELTGDARLTALDSLLSDAQTSQRLFNTNVTMNDDSVWTGRVQVRIGYSYHPRSAAEPWGYDLRDFAEHIKSTRQTLNEFTLRGDIQNSDAMSAMEWVQAVQPASDVWIDMLPAQYNNHFYAISDAIEGTASSRTYTVVDASGRPIEGAYASTVDATQVGGTNQINQYKLVVVAEKRDRTTDFQFKVVTAGGTAFTGNLYHYDRTTPYTQNANHVYTIPVNDYIIENRLDVREGDLADYSYVLNEGEANERTVDPTKYQWLAGIYKAVYTKNGGNYDRYYAVQEIPVIDENGHLSTVTFQNTRIGIINYHIQFKWNVGSRMNEMEKVTLRLTADYHDGTGPHVVKYDGKEYIDLDLIDGVNDYYITGLPKYTPTGELITYTVQEMKVNDTPFVRNRCTLGNDTLTTNINDLDYIVNEKSNSDDLIPIIITNSFSGITDCTVNKTWKDDTNALNTRTDLYLRLYRHSTDPADVHQRDSTVGQDYLWKKQPGDSDNHWSYTYSSLPKYDNKGYRYEYYVKEITTNFVQNDYETYYENAIHMTATGTGGTYTSNDSVFTIPQSQATTDANGFDITISHLAAQDDFFSGAQEADSYYEFRAADLAGDALTEQEDHVVVTTGTPVNGLVSVRVRYTGIIPEDGF